MISAYVIPIFTVLGVIVGGGISYLTSKNIKWIEFRQSSIRYEIENRRRLYVNFLAEANVLVLKAIEKKSSVPTFISDILRLLAEIELVGSEEVNKKAKEIVDYILDLNTRGEINDNNFPLMRAQLVALVKQEFHSIEKNR
ncbi:hypothetical protein [Aeromonas veronii]|uniref:hypothetical protein n=1 Tax=Aeromonas veronii TaxID=654 RepID=UPI003BA1F242